ncbi:ABC transporter substrate-binding protein [Acidimangrovimonas sediminis]|uniref:ABC transporter substrate-binding protein n=1 Tax=Acidimangrovimonas sediminis TaxID=2056283 RepID=UPI000C7F7D11|nr:ABC transporter substrate-binding protein [Acidimangrovimonas sediminis]
MTKTSFNSGRVLSAGVLSAVLTVGLGAGLFTAGAASAEMAKGDTSGMKIGFSSSYSGSSFRQVMNRNFEETAKQAQKDGLIGGYGLVSANNNVTEQAGQIQNMVLQGYKAIVILAASDTALNGAVRDACSAGVKVVVFAGSVTEKCAYTVNYDWAQMGKAEVDYLNGRLKGKGNLLEIRGIAGDSTDKDISDGIHAAASKEPGLKFVGTVYGQWTQTVAQKEVSTILPTLPQVDGVVTQGGDGYGAAQAFSAAGRKLPIIIMGNRYDELAWWQKQHAKDGYETMSLGATPSVVEAAFWVAQQLLAGRDVPKKIEVPLLTVQQKDLDAWVKATPKGGVANAPFTRDLTSQIIDANEKGAALPAIPTPKS